MMKESDRLGALSDHEIALRNDHVREVIASQWRLRAYDLIRHELVTFELRKINSSNIYDDLGVLIREYIGIAFREKQRKQSTVRKELEATLRKYITTDKLQVTEAEVLAMIDAIVIEQRQAAQDQ